MPFQKGIEGEYFEWLYDYVCKGRSHNKISYIKLFEYLHRVEFTFTIPNDINRARDGVDLRYRFAMLNDDESILAELDGPCSVLEMMVALAIRCEETIMDNTCYGNRTGQWFWSMMNTLGISHMSDDKFDVELVEDNVYRFLERRYEPDGEGGLFRIMGCPDDLREREIWVQLCWYLDNFV